MPESRTEELHQAAENLRELRRAHADELHRARGGKLGSHHAAELLRQAQEPYPFPNPDRRASCQRCAAAQEAQYRLLTETLRDDPEGIPDGVNTSATLARSRQRIARYHLLAQIAPH